MKKNLFVLGLIAIFAMALTNCSKSEVEEEVVNVPQEEVSEGIPFEIQLSGIVTKTTNDGLSTKWAAGDDIMLFHAVAGSTEYVKDGQFTISDIENGVFTGTLASALDPAVSYDWYVHYPYISQIKTPANTNAGYTTVAPINQTQTGNDSKAHIAELPLVGKTTTAAGVSKPTVSMYQAASVIKVIVTNNSGADLPVTSLKITAPAENYISGNYYLNFTDPTSITYTAAASKSNAANLSASYLIPNLGTGTFFIAVKPFNVAVNDDLKVKVNNYEKTLKITGSAKNFPAGKISTFNFNYNEAASVATLPFSIDGSGGAAAYTSEDGLSASGLGADYSSGTHGAYITKMDTDGDYIQVRFNQAAYKASIGVKMIGGNSTSYIDVKGSADGITFTQIEKLTISGKQNDILDLETIASIDDSYRYLRFVFTKGSNIGVGPVSISKPSTDPDILATNITDVAVAGVTTTMTYTLKNFGGVDDIVPTCDGTVVTSVSKPSNGTISYTVAPNYGTATRSTGTITLTSASKSVDKVITVTQNGETFVYTGSTTITLTKTDNSYQDINITTASFAWASTVTPETGMNLTITPSSGSANASAQTLRITSTTAATASEQTLGTIVLYRNGNESDSQKITLTIKKASASGSSYSKVTSITAGREYLLVDISNNKVATGVISSNTLQSDDVTISGGNSITGNATIDGYTITIANSDTGYYTLKHGDDYIGYANSSTNMASSSADPTNYYKWSIEIDGETGSATILNKGKNTRYIGWNNSSGWKAYATSNIATYAPPVLFIKNL